MIFDWFSKLNLLLFQILSTKLFMEHIKQHLTKASLTLQVTWIGKLV